MANFALQQDSRPALSIQSLMSRLVLGLAIATLFLMALGSSTRVMNAGLACPDWPLCYGELVPTSEMNLQVFLEWFHRLVATGVGLATLALTGLAWWKRQELPRWFPWGMLVAVSLVVFQGVLGGLTVTELLRFDIVTAHLGTGLLFFSTLVVLAMAPWPYAGNSRPSKLPWVGLTAAVLVYLQSLLGGLVASRWALHQCFSGFQLCAVMNSHIIGVFPAAIATLTLVIWALKTSDLHPLLRRVAHIAGAVLALQVGLGIATFRLHLQVEPLTVSHQAVGATLLGTLLVFTVLSFRGVGRSPQPAA